MSDPSDSTLIPYSEVKFLISVAVAAAIKEKDAEIERFKSLFVGQTEKGVLMIQITSGDATIKTLYTEKQAHFIGTIAEEMQFKLLKQLRKSRNG